VNNHIEQLIQKFFRRHIHSHIIEVVNMATGTIDDKFSAVTGWKWQCILCGKTIYEIDEVAIELLQSKDIWDWLISEKA